MINYVASDFDLTSVLSFFTTDLEHDPKRRTAPAPHDVARRPAYCPRPTTPIITGTSATMRTAPAMSKEKPVRIIFVIGTAPVP